jgi:hypothetical protein
MTESPHLDDYLNTIARRGPLRGLTARSYLHKILADQSARHGIACERALLRDLERGVFTGEIIRLPARGGGTAYHRIADIRWPIAIPLMPWLREHSTACVPLEIRCAHHLMRHEIGFVSGWEVRVVFTQTDRLRRTLNTRATTLQRPRGREDPAVPTLRSLLLQAALELAAPSDDEPVSPFVDVEQAARPIGLAAALLHARDCLHAEAISRAVRAEIKTTRRVSHALRSAADPAWVALQALEATQG